MLFFIRWKLTSLMILTVVKPRALVFFALCSLCLLSSKALAQQTDRNQLPEIGVVASDALTIEKEKTLGDAIMRELRASAPLVLDPVVQSYIQDVGNRLVVNADNAKFPFHFFMLNDSAINAFAFYGGHIGVHTGLMVRADTESELASVLAHEIAHVTQRHLARRLQSQKRGSSMQIARLIGGLLLALADAEAGIAAVQTSAALNKQESINFTRNNEQEADNIGINILYRSGFDPMGATGFFQKLQGEMRGRSTQLAFLMTHPLPTDRVAQATVRAREYGDRRLPQSIDFHLAKARIKARYMATPKQNIEYFQTQTSSSKTTIENLASKYGLAISLFENEEYQQALNVMQKLIKGHAENLFFLDLLTDIYIQLDEPSKAIELLLPAWRLKPQNDVLALNLANAYIHSGEYQPAIQILRDLLLVNKEQFVAYQLLQDAYSQSQQKKMAHMAQAEIYALISAYPLAIDELQFAYNEAGSDSLEKQRIKARIEQFRAAQESLQNLRL